MRDWRVGEVHVGDAHVGRSAEAYRSCSLSGSGSPGCDPEGALQEVRQRGLYKVSLPLHA